MWAPFFHRLKNVAGGLSKYGMQQVWCQEGGGGGRGGEEGEGEEEQEEQGATLMQPSLING